MYNEKTVSCPASLSISLTPPNLNAHVRQLLLMKLVQRSQPVSTPSLNTQGEFDTDVDVPSCKATTLVAIHFSMAVALDTIILAHLYHLR